MEFEGQKTSNKENVFTIVVNEEKVSTTVGSRVKDVVSEFCDDSTIHGVKNIGKTENHICFRIFWALCTIASTIYCIISCKDIFENYYTRPTSTKISLVNEIPTQFPKVTFCNVNTLDKSNNETLNFINQTEIFNEFDARVVIGNSNLTDIEKKNLVSQSIQCFHGVYIIMKNAPQIGFHTFTAKGMEIVIHLIQVTMQMVLIRIFYHQA